jgi:hypothetical protein
MRQASSALDERRERFGIFHTESDSKSVAAPTARDSKSACVHVITRTPS